MIYLPMPTMLHGWWSLLTVAAAARKELGRVVEAARLLVTVVPTKENAK